MNRRSMDILLLWAVLTLVGLGVVMVYSASSVNAAAKLGDSDYYLKRQAVFAVAGVVALFIGSAVPSHLWRNFAVPILAVAFLSLVLVKIPGLGRSGGGAQRWLQLGPMAFQPSELCKFALLNFLAYSLYKKRDRIEDLKRGFLPHVLVAGAMGLSRLCAGGGRIRTRHQGAHQVYSGRNRKTHRRSRRIRRSDRPQ